MLLILAFIIPWLYVSNAQTEMSSGGLIQKTPNCAPLNPDEIDDLIMTILNMQNQLGDFKQLITEELFVYVCHKAMSVLEFTPTLVFVHDPSGVAVIGDIHGSFCDLMKSLNSAGWPSQRTLLFLGDFCDRNFESLKVILFLYLLLIRYPNRVFLLRGNHEVIDTNYHFTLFNEIRDHFGSENKQTYEFIFSLVNTTFDFLPLAAIVSRQIFCCHGGVSRYVRDFKDIARIKRPVLREGPLHRNMLIMTDLLWADPSNHEAELYEPSSRHISYTFNTWALRNFLQSVGCRCLIRAHQPFENGFEILCNGLCLSIHSALIPPFKNYNGAILVLEFDSATNYITAYVKRHVAGESNVSAIVARLATIFQETRSLYCIMPESNNAICESCITWKSGAITLKYMQKQRTIGHVELVEEIDNYATESPLGEYYYELFEQSSDYDSRKKPTCAARMHPALLEELAKEGIVPNTLDDEQYKHPSSSIVLPNYGFNIPMDPAAIWPILQVVELGFTAQ